MKNNLAIWSHCLWCVINKSIQPRPADILKTWAVVPFMKLIDTYGLGLEPPLTAVFLIPLTILLALERTVAIYLHVNQQLCDAGVLIYEHWF